jgi:hypothetical protein
VVDLLLINATNLPWRPIFPYAFVQVSAVARRHGLDVKVLDLLDVPRDRWRTLLASHLEATQPRMVGLHIRQGDSVFIEDYYASPNGAQTTRSYFPIDDNIALAAMLRSLTRVPIIVGGFGFTTHAARLYELLGVDYGVQGDPDDVFARFEDVVAGRELSSVKSLIHAGGINERGYFAPYEGIEYIEPVVDEMVRFYGHAQLFGTNPPTVAVEVMRGCPFRCFFCTEPHVKGRSFRYRDLDVIEAELDGLVRRQLRRFWLVCSELDLQGVKFGLELAERIVRMRERHGGLPIEWSAYSLPRLEEDELRLLQRAGYTGALNDVLSLDDENLRRAGVPYRSKQAISFLKAVTRLDREEAGESAANAAAAEAKVRAGLTQRSPKELASVFGLFLGNAHATASTIATTLRRIEEEGLRENYRAGLAFPSTRVFAPDGVPICETTTRGLRTYGRDGDRSIDHAHPTFYYPDFLIEQLGSPAGVVDFMRYVGDTFMSVGHRGRKDWAWFLSNHITIPELAQLMESAGPLAEPVRLREIFSPPPAAKPAWNATAKRVIDHVLGSITAEAQRVRAALGIANPANEYQVTEALYARFASRDEVVAAVAPSSVAERFFLDWLLYANNVQLRPEYRELLFGPAPAA